MSQTTFTIHFLKDLQTMQRFKYQIETKITESLWKNIEKDVFDNINLGLCTSISDKMYVSGQKNFFDIWSEILNKAERIDTTIPIISRPASECAQTMQILSNKAIFMWSIRTTKTAWKI